MALKGEEKPKYFQDLYAIAKGFVIVACGFILLVSMIMLMRQFQLRLTNPTDNEALQRLTERSQQRPADEGLRDAVRNFQLTARKAYFTALWQINTGAYVLVGNAAVLGISLWVIRLVGKKNPVPKGIALVEEFRISRTKSRLVWGIIGVILLVSLLVLIVSSRVLPIHVQTPNILTIVK